MSIFFKYTRAIKAISLGLRYPSLLIKSAKAALNYLYWEGMFRPEPIKRKSLSELCDIKKEIKLSNFLYREGNAYPFELMAISHLICELQPKNLLEIGTFDGNTTLQMALNSPETAVIHTLDLPQDHISTKLPIIKKDMKYIKDEQKQKRKYVGSSVERKIVQHFGDSSTYDFNLFTQNGPVDFCYIDAGHSYENIKNDTEKALKILSPNGMILWHDFDPNCPGVYKYLCERSKEWSLLHIEGTRFVLLNRCK